MNTVETVFEVVAPRLTCAEVESLVVTMSELLGVLPCQVCGGRDVPCTLRIDSSKAERHRLVINSCCLPMGESLALSTKESLETLDPLNPVS